MKNRIKALRYFVSAMAISMACSLVGFAQTAAPAKKEMPAAMAAKPVEDWKTNWVAEWTRAKDYTKEYLDVMPEDGLGFKPTPDIRSFAEQMLHLASANFGFASQAIGTKNPYDGKNLEKMDEYKTSKAALTKVVMESYDFMIDSIKGMDTSKSNEAIKLFGRMDSTRGVAVAKCFEHQTHHRGQTTIYIRLKGVKPPNEKLF
jgi:uncharacterized damage-inducible protein DinB